MLQPLFPAAEPDDLSSHAHRQLVGFLGLALPPLLWLTAGWRTVHGIPGWAPLTSVSAYYHTGAVAVFVGVLIVLAAYLFTYRGYRNDSHHRDRNAAVVAGGAAVLVAFFPTSAPAAISAPAWWTPLMAKIHGGAAVVLFGAFIYFSLILFPKSATPSGSPLPPDKRRRNLVYRLCGAAMSACLIWAGVAGLGGKGFFWPEAMALEFFAISWLVKGKAGWTAVAVGQRSLYYGKHPRELVGKAWNTVRGRSGPPSGQ